MQRPLLTQVVEVCIAALNEERSHYSFVHSKTECMQCPLLPQVVEVCIAALNLGAIVAYLNILADVLSSVAGTIIPPGAEPSRSAYIAGGEDATQLACIA